jgi:amidophosphoribosyltransferase
MTTVAKEVHIRISCPPLVYSCPFIGFTASKGDLELITRRIIKEFEGDDSKNLDKYSDASTPEYKRMVAKIAEKLGMDTLKFNTVDDIVKAIGLPKCKICTHCFDGSSHF